MTRWRARTGQSDPFAALGLARAGDLTDDAVRAAWRRIAAATHPDRGDGGDPQRFAAAASGYALLRTPSGRGEALADLSPAWQRPAAAALADRIRSGRPARLGLRLLAAALAVAGAVAAVGQSPALPALITGVLTWLALTARHDLAPPGGPGARPGPAGGPGLPP